MWFDRLPDDMTIPKREVKEEKKYCVVVSKAIYDVCPFNQLHNSKELWIISDTEVTLRDLDKRNATKIVDCPSKIQTEEHIVTFIGDASCKVLAEKFSKRYSIRSIPQPVPVWTTPKGIFPFKNFHFEQLDYQD